MQGKIINITNKLVVVEDSESKNIVKCNLKGKFKHDKINFLVGDDVTYQMDLSEDYGIVTKLLERKNSLIRPPVSNVDQVILVFSAKSPDINFEILDTFLSVIEKEEIDIVLCLNKTDIARDEAIKIKDKYEKIGYKVILASAKDMVGIEEIKEVLKGKTTVFAGPSGVGKSSILNDVLGEDRLEIGTISDRTLRGRHTTKGTTLITLDSGGKVFDTAGFTTIDLLKIELDELEGTFREFRPYLGMCKFTGCKHDKEIKCMIKEKVEEGIISKERYEMYKLFYEKLLHKEKVREKDNKHYRAKKIFVSSKEANKRGLTDKLR